MTPSTRTRWEVTASTSRGSAGRCRIARNALGLPSENARIAARGHDRGEARDALGGAGRHRLRDHASHRNADDVRLCDAERVEEARDVFRHVLQRVRRANLEAQQRASDRERDVGKPSAVDLLRVAAIAIVEAHHVEAARRQALDERIGPEHERHAETHDQHERRGRRIAARLVGERQTVCRRDGHHKGGFTPSILPCRFVPLLPIRAACFRHAADAVFPRRESRGDGRRHDARVGCGVREQSGSA